MNPETLEILSGHNAWATRVLIDDAAKLTDAQLQQRFEIGPGSIHDTLRHIIGAMLRWADRIGGRPVRESIQRDDRRFTTDELRTLLQQADGELRHVAAELDARNGWRERMEFVMEADKTYFFTRAAAMLHVLTHGMHHRAQIVNMRRQLGRPPLGLDLDVVEWECVQTGQIAAAST